jgi:NDP-sugar pyrophosphorylase family protein
VDEGGRISAFREKPPLPYWINAGVYILGGVTMDRFPEVGDHETELFPQLAEEGRIAGFKSSAFWKSVETQKDLREAEGFVGEAELFSSMRRG